MKVYRADVEIYRRENGRYLTNDDFWCHVAKTLEGALRESLQFAQDRLAELYDPTDEFETFDDWMAADPVRGEIWICELDLDSGEYGIERTYDLAGNLTSECAP